jgi:hypothetical protein
MALMGISIALTITSVGPTTAGTMPINGIAAITNTEADTLTVRSITIAEGARTQLGARVSGPYFMTNNVAPGEGFPDIATSATAHYPFSVVVPSPNTPGSSPNAPGGPTLRASPPSNTFMELVGNVRALDTNNDPHVGTGCVFASFITPVAPFPVPMGGALQFNKTGANLASLLFMGAL